MPRPTNKYDRQHLQHLQQLQRQIDAIYKEATREAAAIGMTVQNFNPDKPFTFDDYPLTRERVERLMMSFKAAVEVCVVNGVESEWTLANNKNNELANRVFGKNVGRLTHEQYRRYYSTNEAARDAFLQRKERGLSLSDRVWRYTGAFKDEIEMGLDLGLRGGLSADQMTHDLRQYLQHPNTLFRRVRDEHGILHLSKHAATFHPGRGVYRSSYMNARRLAATEGNIAYRTSDHTRWQQMDFVVGIEIHLSNNHTCKGRDGKPHPFHDICDELQGRYPKDFKFTGWHPHCRCYATSILKTDEEIARDTQRILNGEPLDGESVNRVEDVPDAFKQWLSDNEERAATSYSVPYFIKDNMQYVPAALREAYASRMPYDTYEEYAKAMRYNARNAGFTTEQKGNIAKLNQVLPVVQGKVMNFTEADGKKVNPDFDTSNKSVTYNYNCGTCVPTYLLRRWGYDVTAGAYTKGKGVVYDISKNGLKPWLRQDGTEIKITDPEVVMFGKWQSSLEKGKPAGLVSFVSGNTSEAGIYMVRLGWKNGGGHLTIAERDKDGNLIFYDPQSGEKGWYSWWRNLVVLPNCWLMRIDDKLINPDVGKAFKKACR